MSAPNQRPRTRLSRPPQRYRATWEFVLRNPRDYETLRTRLQRSVDLIIENFDSTIQSDYLAIEKCGEPWHE